MLAGAVLISLMPTPFSRFVVKADVPEFFRDGMYARYLNRCPVRGSAWTTGRQRPNCC